jgi:hypothetical protein
MEQAFALTYSMKGITWTDLKTMTRKQRIWMLRRLKKQKDEELAELEKKKKKLPTE